MEMFVYRGLSSIPSIDINCQRIIAYIKRCQAPIVINTNGNPFQSPNGMLPYMLVENGDKIAGYENIVAYLSDSMNCEKFTLNPSKYVRNLSEAYTYLLRDHLEPCIQYFLWGDPQNAEHTRLMYAKRTPFPYSFYYPQKYIRAADMLMTTLKHFSTEDKLENHDTQSMLMDAVKTLNQLEAKLGDKHSILGEPSELDCTLYAYLSVIMYCLPHNNAVRIHLTQCSQLVRFVSRFQSLYLFELMLPNPDVAEEQRLLGTSISHDMDSESSKWLAKLLAAGIAIGAMSLFAIKQGIFNISDSTYNSQYDEDDDDDEGSD